MTLRGLIFDVDGTLADTEEVHRQAFNAAFAAEGLPWAWDRRAYRDLLKVTGGQERIAHFIDALEIPASEKSKFVARVPVIHANKTQFYTNMVVAGGVNLRPGIAALLEEARNADLALAIATTTSGPNVEALLQRTLGPRALRWFGMIATGDLGVAKKPAPDIYLHVLDRLGLPPQDVIAFEDSANGLMAAKQAGLFTVVTPTQWTEDEDLSAADVILADLGDNGNLSFLSSQYSRALKSPREFA